MSFTVYELDAAVGAQDLNSYGDYEPYHNGNHFFADGGYLEGLGFFTPVASKAASYRDAGYENTGANYRDCWYVIEHNDSGRLFYRKGNYSSYDGYDFDSTEEVERVTETVTFESFKVGNKVVQRGKELS